MIYLIFLPDPRASVAATACSQQRRAGATDSKTYSTTGALTCSQVCALRHSSSRPWAALPRLQPHLHVPLCPPGTLPPCASLRLPVPSALPPQPPSRPHRHDRAHPVIAHRHASPPPPLPAPQLLPALPCYAPPAATSSHTLLPSRHRPAWRELAPARAKHPVAAASLAPPSAHPLHLSLWTPEGLRPFGPILVVDSR